jgi:polyphenol oxidase
MQRHTNGSLSWLTFDLFADCPKLSHGVFLRHGGVSTGDFHSLNFGISQGDASENVLENRCRAMEALEISQSCSLWQQHGTQIVSAKPHVQEKGDGLTTNSSGLGLSILHADCQAAIFYDPIHHAISNIHAGWRGNVQNIYREAILTMKALYGSKPENLLVAISPSLGPEASEFIHFEKELPSFFLPFQIKPTYFDLWAISHWQLTECGILPHHIEIAEICTYSHPEDFFSYRRMKASGRHATFVALQ